MSVNTAKKDLNLLYLAIYVVIVALFFFVLPPFEPITKAGMRLLQSSAGLLPAKYGRAY